MKLYCVNRYRGVLNHKVIDARPGDVLEVDNEDDFEWLMNDSPGAFHKSPSKSFTAAKKRMAKDDGMQNRMVSAVADRGEGPVISTENFGAVKS